MSRLVDLRTMADVIVFKIVRFQMSTLIRNVCVSICIHFQQRFQIEAFSVNTLSVFERISVDGSVPKRIEMYAFSNENALVWIGSKAFNDDLAKVSWNALENVADINIRLEQFNKAFLAVLNSHAPVKSIISFKHRANPSISPGIKNQMKVRDTYLWNARRTRCNIFKRTQIEVKKNDHRSGKTVCESRNYAKQEPSSCHLENYPALYRVYPKKRQPYKIYILFVLQKKRRLDLGV